MKANNFYNLRLKSAMALLNAVFAVDSLREFALDIAEKRLYRNLVEINPDGRPVRRQEDRFYVLRNMFHSINKALDNNRISASVRRALLKILVGNVMLGEKERRAPFKEKYNFDPPAFVTISPTKRCNLHCIGCYASSSSANAEKLDYDIVSRIVRETRENWGSHFTVISGGEPFMWRSQGKDIIDLAAEHPDTFFMMYTNGTLINEKVAARLAEVGNLTPAISVEGLEKETDARRGKGAFKQILKGMENLRNDGVPFGISVTATNSNAELVVSDEFIDFFFNEQGAIYGWVFQYMPIGRSYTLDLMITPEQRRWMYEKEQHLVRDKKIFMADFWNSGPVSNGCISAGRSGGYFYIDWNGNVSPCVFFPYGKHNIVDIYKQGGDLNTILFSPYFESIRQWQYDYGFKQPAHEVKNQIVPCPIRDHHRFAKEVIMKHQAEPIDAEAAAALKDDKYHEKLADYGDKVAELTSDIWEIEYIGPERQRSAA